MIASRWSFSRTTRSAGCSPALRTDSGNAMQLRHLFSAFRRFSSHMFRIGGFCMPANVPPSDHVMRYAAYGRLRRDGDDNVLGLLPQAFLRKENEEYLSVTWVEYFPGAWA